MIDSSKQCNNLIIRGFNFHRCLSTAKTGKISPLQIIPAIRYVHVYVYMYMCVCACVCVHVYVHAVLEQPANYISQRKLGLDVT